MFRRPAWRIHRAYRGWLARAPLAQGTPDGPRISILLPVHNVAAPYLRACLASVFAQSYRNWELCVADDASDAPHVGPLLAEAACDARVRLARLAENGGIAAATNAALALATGDFVALLDHDDMLAPQALARIAAEIARYPDLCVVFSDEDQLVRGRRCRPYFKPGWNPDLMLSQNLVSHLGVYRRSVVQAIGGMRPGFEGSQDYDFALRAIAAAPPGAVRHVPAILYHWRQHERSFSAQRLAACAAAARRAVQEVLPGIRAEPDATIPNWTRIRHPLPAPPPMAVVVAAGEAPADPDYPWARPGPETAAAGPGDVLVFCAPGLQPAAPGWLRELVSQALRPDIGCAGARLDTPDGRIWHAGFQLDPDTIAATPRPRSDRRDPGYAGHFVLARSVSAVSRDCLAVRAALFAELGGFDPRAGHYTDIDFCLRLAERGLRCVWTPHARLRYRALPCAISDPEGAAFMRRRWSETLAHDPYVNPHLVLRRGRLSLENW